MLLQGSLQAVFDALYEMGIIDPVLKMDWSETQSKTVQAKMQMRNAMAACNRCKGDLDQLVNELANFDSETLQALAMEVAREYADFHSRTSLQ